MPKDRAEGRLCLSTYVLFRAGLQLTQVTLGDVAYDTASYLLEGQAFKRE